MTEGILLIAISEEENDLLDKAARSLDTMAFLTKNEELSEQAQVIYRLHQRVRFTQPQHKLFAQPTAEEVGKPAKGTGS